MSNIHKSWLIFLVTYTNAFAGTLIQLRDYLCGCDYCETVNPQEPLDIAGHMMRCHSQRESMIKTMQLMREIQEPTVDVPPKEESVFIDSEDMYTHDDYSWNQVDIYGWVYTQHEQFSVDVDKWIYLEALEWVWSPADMYKFVYSYDHGWLYNDMHQGTRIIYWYDKRIWTTINNFR